MTRVFSYSELLTDRLELREYVPRDEQASLEGCSDPETARWLTRLPKPYDREAARAWVTQGYRERLESGDGINFMIVERATDTVVGGVGLHGTKWDEYETVIGYWAHPIHRGKGYVQEAVNGLVEWAFARGFTTVKLEADRDNHASQAVALKTGFTQIGEKDTLFVFERRA
jgi:RimJ/RimL family protein N-acetyltransferase